MTISHSFRRRGSAFIVTLWVISALSGLTLVLAHSVRVEALAASNRLSLAQADAASRGAEQFAISLVDQEIATPGTTAQIFAKLDPVSAAIRIGDGPTAPYVWIIKPDPIDETAISFGLTDEASKLDINRASPDSLARLPNITQENNDSLVDWRDADSTQSSEGAEDSYYLSLPQPYHCKNAPFETVEELLLVKSFNTDILFGQDRTRSGHVNQAPDLMTPTLTFGSSTSNRGIFPFITVYGVKASTVPSSKAIPANQTADVNSADQTQLRNVLTKNNFSGDANNVIGITRDQRPFLNVFDWAVRTNLTADQFSKVYAYVRSNPTQANLSKINVNTASRQVLLCIPAFTDADADAILNHVQQNPNPTDPTDISWLLDCVSKPTLRLTGSLLTGMSYCYSADILVCSADGRAFKRTRVVIDASTGTSKILYRRDLTNYGWPLDPGIRTALRSGKPLEKTGGMLPMKGVAP